MAICLFCFKYDSCNAAVMYNVIVLFQKLRTCFKFLRLNRFLFIGGINDQFQANRFLIFRFLVAGFYCNLINRYGDSNATRGYFWREIAQPPASCEAETTKMSIRHISHNAPNLPPNFFRNLCFSFLLGITAVPRQIGNNAYPRFLGK